MEIADWDAVGWLSAERAQVDGLDGTGEAEGWIAGVGGGLWSEEGKRTMICVKKWQSKWLGRRAYVESEDSCPLRVLLRIL